MRSCDDTSSWIQPSIFQNMSLSNQEKLTFDCNETWLNECNVSVHNRYYNLQVLLGKPEYLQVDVSNRIHHLVAKFLTATGIKI